MSKFHSSVTRRDFMKALGFGAAGMGTAAAASPVFHDLDEVIASPTASSALPWYVKERELLNPTCEIDWDLMKRTDNRYAVQGDLARSHYPESYARYNEARAAGSARRQERYDAQDPGYDHKWRALNNGKSNRSDHPDYGHAGLDPEELGSSAADMGLPNWTGSPEEARRLMTAAMRYFGIAYMGFADLDSTYRNKIVMEFTRSDRNARAGDVLIPERADRYVYEDVERAYEEPTGQGGHRLVIPTKPVTLLLMASPQTPELRKTNSIMSNTNNPAPDNMHSSIEVRLSRFLHALGGYQLFGQSGHQSMPVNAGAATCLTGVGEQSRQNNYALSLELGPNYNPLTLMCDLVVEPTKPIDAGMFKFCHTCAICAHQCPSDSISLEKEPSYEIPLTEGRPTVYKNPGPKLFWINMVSCRMYTSEFDGCAPKQVLGNDYGGGRSCFAVCPFGEDRAAMAHELIRTAMATTSLFNGFFASMADVFGTGQSALRPDDWWDMGLPALAMPTHIRATKGQWKM